MIDRPACVLWQRDDGVLLAEDTQGDVQRVFVPKYGPYRITLNKIIMGWLHSEDYQIIEIDEEDLEIDEG